MFWHRWHWLNDIVLPVLVAVMRLCWLWPWLQFIQRGLAPDHQGAILSPWMIVGLLLGAMVMARWVLSQGYTLTRARVWIASAGIGTILLSLWWSFAREGYPLWDVRWLLALGWQLSHWQDRVPLAFIALLVGAYLWLRGVLDGRQPPIHEHIWGSFIAGFLTLAFLLLVSSTHPSGLPSGTERWILAFFAVGMAALALSSLEIALHSGERKKEMRPRLSRYWLASVLSVIIALLSIGLLLSAIITPETLRWVLGWISALLKIAGVVLYYVIFAITYVVFLFLSPLFQWLKSMLNAAPRSEPIKLPDFQQQLEEVSQRPGAGMPPAVGEAARWLGILGLILVIGLAFALALRRFWSRETEEVEETRELIFSRDLVGEQLASLWRRWRERFRRTSRKAMNPFLPLDGESQPRRAIRALYQALLAMAKERGYPRGRGQTPMEYQRTLSAVLPNARAPLAIMTRGYIQARYGVREPSTEQVEEVRRAWDRVRIMIRDLDGQKQRQSDESESC